LHTTWVGFRRGQRLRDYGYEFVKMLGPHLDRKLVDRVAARRDEAAAVFKRISLPMR
jgi:hypothetical protein